MRHACISLALILSLSFSAFGQPRRPSPTAKAGYPPEKADAFAEADPLGDYSTKGLPDAYLFGGAASPELARKAAAAILKNDRDSLPALIGALQKSGFHIIDKDQKILFLPTGDPNGAAFFDYEVAGMLRATQLGMTTTLDKMGDMLANNDPELKRLQLPSLILSDLRSWSTLTKEQVEQLPPAEMSARQQNGYLAALVIELGAETGGFTTTVSKLNLIQASIIERRFLSDLVSTYAALSSGQAFMPRRPAPERGPSVFMNASWKAIPDPCAAIDVIGKLQGYESKAKKVIKLFDKLSETLETGEFPTGSPAGGISKKIPGILTGPKKMFEERFKNVAAGIEKLNVVMSYVKLVAANMNIHADLTVEDPVPLIRTKSDRNTGQERVVTAKFRIDFAGSQEINCTAKAAKIMTGLDIQAPEDGPLKNVPVIWEPLLEGNGYSRFTGYPVLVDAVDTGRRDISRQKTNDLGENQIKLTGKPQARNMEQEPVVPMAKKADLRVSIATSEMDASKDLPKIFFFGAGGKFGIGALIEIAPEILGKMALRSFRVSVPVRDWQPCSEDWGGIVKLHRVVNKTVAERSGTRLPNGNTTGTGLLRVSEVDDAEIVLNPRTPQEIASKAPPKLASVSARGVHSSIGEFLRAGDPCCGSDEGVFHTKLRRGEEFKYQKTLKMMSPVAFSGSERDYWLMFQFTLDEMIPVTVRKFGEVLESNCPLEGGWSRTEESFWAYAAILPQGRWGERYLNPEGELLSGTKTIDTPDGATVTWEWALARCKR